MTWNGIKLTGILIFRGFSGLRDQKNVRNKKFVSDVAGLLFHGDSSLEEISHIIIILF